MSAVSKKKKKKKGPEAKARKLASTLSRAPAYQGSHARRPDSELGLEKEALAEQQEHPSAGTPPQWSPPGRAGSPTAQICLLLPPLHLGKC